jgi:hypothetical protein
MNWKNVAFLVSVERKSGRLIRGQRLIHYRESKLGAYLFYLIALGLGIVIGLLAGNFYRTGIILADPTLAAQLQPLVYSFLFSLPTLVLIYSLVFTMLSQIQRSGIKATSQVPYWLPITWQEHTLASILANMMGFPLISIVGIAVGIVAFASFAGLIVPAVLASLAMVGAAFMASATTEVFRILQVRFIGAVYKTTGRAAIWVRFAGSLIFFLLFYVAYFSVVYGSGALTLIQVVSSTQNTAWFVPFVWLGIMLYYFISGLLLQGLLFMALSLLFIAGLFFLGTWLNERFGLYEPPAITVTRGMYAPKTGLLGRLGFSTIEAALIRKDLKAFTRRRELMTIFIAPIVVILIPLFQSMGQVGATAPSSLSLFFEGLTFLFPASLMAMSLGNLIIGEEGQAVWRIYAAPFSARSLVKSKYFFIVFFGLIVLAITGTLGTILYRASFRVVFVGTLEAIFLVFALGAVSLANGIKGADFNEVPRARMIRVEWGLINFIACFLLGAAVLGPLFPNVLSSLIPGVIALDPFVALAISGVIAAVLTVVFYRVAVVNAEELLRNASS